MSTEPIKWYAVSATVPSEYVETVEFAFNNLDSLGSDVDLMSNKNSDASTVTGYFSQPPDADHVLTEIKNAAAIYSLSTEVDFALRFSVIENQDWLAEWKKYWKPVEIGRFVIAAPWHEINDSTKTVIRIEPNMAFGTGTHETTQLCLKAIDENYHADQSFLDVGTGTGILAIAAAKISEGDVIVSGVDTDADSIDIAVTNAELNGVANRINFAVGSINQEIQSYDFVCANLTADVIVPILPTLLAKTVRTLVLSGILAEQEKAVLDTLPKNLRREIERDGEWISITVEGS